RASRCLYQGSKAYAAMQGRNFVIPEDIKMIWKPVMEHRVVLTNDARYQKKTPESILSELLEETEVPPYKKELFHGRKTE
ncbi:MAG: AAA family ATPase, partial [Clostridiaceae bacterium]|nr:AAA family ATPase [Clostridiaceae bacterium]